jgi:hypothetical protein
VSCLAPEDLLSGLLQACNLGCEPFPLASSEGVFPSNHVQLVIVHGGDELWREDVERTILPVEKAVFDHLSADDVDESLEGNLVVALQDVVQVFREILGISLPRALSSSLHFSRVFLVRCTACGGPHLTLNAQQEIRFIESGLVSLGEFGDEGSLPELFSDALVQNDSLEDVLDEGVDGDNLRSVGGLISKVHGEQGASELLLAVRVRAHVSRG